MISGKKKPMEKSTNRKAQTYPQKKAPQKTQKKSTNYQTQAQKKAPQKTQKKSTNCQKKAQKKPQTTKHRHKK